MNRPPLIRPRGRRDAAIWVSAYNGTWSIARHLADCDYFVYEPIAATDAQMKLPVCQWCMTRMRESMPPPNRRGPRKKPHHFD